MYDPTVTTIRVDIDHAQHVTHGTVPFFHAVQTFGDAVTDAVHAAVMRTAQRCDALDVAPVDRDDLHATRETLYHRGEAGLLVGIVFRYDRDNVSCLRGKDVYGGMMVHLTRTADGYTAHVTTHT